MLKSISKCVYIIDFLVSNLFLSFYVRCAWCVHVYYVHKGGNFISIFHLDYFNFSLNTLLPTLPLRCFFSLSFTHRSSNHSHSCFAIFLPLCIFNEKPKYFYVILCTRSKSIPTVKNKYIFYLQELTHITNAYIV